MSLPFASYGKRFLATACLFCLASLGSVSYAQSETHMNASPRAHVTLAFNASRCPNLQTNDRVVNLGVRKKDGSIRKDPDGKCKLYTLPKRHTLVITDVSWRASGSGKSFQLHVDQGSPGGVDSEDNRIFWGIGEPDGSQTVGNMSIAGGRVLFSPGAFIDAWTGGTKLLEVFVTGYHVRY